MRAQAQEAVRAELSRGSPGALLVSAAALSSPNERSMDDALAEFKKTAKATAGRRASISIGGKTRSASLAPGLGAVVSALPSCPAVCCVCSCVRLLCGLPSLTPSPLRACVMRACVCVCGFVDFAGGCRLNQPIKSVPCCTCTRLCSVP